MITTRKGLVDRAAWILVIVIGSASSVRAEVDYRQVGSGAAGDPLVVSVASKPAIARPVDATVTETPVELGAARRGAIPSGAAKVSPVVATDPPFVELEKISAQTMLRPRFLAARPVDSIVTLPATREAPRLASNSARRKRAEASMVRELQQLRAENRLLRQRVTDLRRRP